MKIFVLGAIAVPRSDPKEPIQSAVLNASMETLGGNIARLNHDLLICSPFAGSADLAAFRGAVAIAGTPTHANIEVYFPDEPAVRDELKRTTASVTTSEIKPFPQSVITDASGRPNWHHSWLLCQLAALELCHAVITVGGRPGGSASVALALADSKRKPVLPFTFLGGAADDLFERRRYQLRDRLSDDQIAMLRDPDGVGQAMPMLEALTGSQSAEQSKLQEHRFFLSYSRMRPEEADFVEMTLRRRNMDVFRDDRSFAAGGSLPQEVREAIHRANVFIAIWCQEYACSPWCFDELELAVRRRDADSLKVWLLCVDATRIVPPGARSLINYPCHSREELEGQLLKLLERPETVI